MYIYKNLKTGKITESLTPLKPKYRKDLILMSYGKNMIINKDKVIKKCIPQKKK